MLKEVEGKSSLFLKVDMAKCIHLFNKYLASLLTKFCGRSRGLTKEAGSAFKELSLVDSRGWEPVINSVCSLSVLTWCFESLRRKGIPELRFAGPAEVSWGTASSGHREPHVYECLE